MGSPGKRFRCAIAEGKPLQIVGVINAYVAIMAESIGFKALYLSGAGVANSCYGLPDMGVTSYDNVLEEVLRLTNAVRLPLLVDIDTGWGNGLTITRAIKGLERAGAAAVHIEDQSFSKRCGHLKGKTVVPIETMVDRIKACVDAREDSTFAIMARTDALSVEGLDRTIDRARAYVEAGADMIFAEAFTDLAQYTLCRNTCQVPILANSTEFGATPLFTAEEFFNASVDMVLYPLSANRAMNLAALSVLQQIFDSGTQRNSIADMQTRGELYEFLKYESYQSLF